jgi:hypothetical protein
MMNSRCEKVEMGEGWFGRVAGRWARGQNFMAVVILGGHDSVDALQTFLIFPSPYNYLYDAKTFSFLYNEF